MTLESSLKKALTQAIDHPHLFEVMDYAVFPPGKLFRPKLVEAIALDLGSFSKDHLHLASAIELHHAYTLIHDDLPSMDNDFLRRGKPSTHAAFGEWKAILAGDGLCIASFGELAKINHPRMRELMGLMTWATGPKGLILGQFLDLGAKGKASLKEVVRIHELKTARLIQVATLGSYLLSEPEPKLKGRIGFFRLGREIGVSFQLLDDLGELAEGPATDHEKEINPFLFSPEETHRELDLALGRLRSILTKHHLTHLETMLLEYFASTRKKIEGGLVNLEQNLNKGPAFDQIKNWVNTLV